MKSATGTTTWATDGTRILTVSFTPIFFISYGTISAGNIGIVVRDNSGASTNQIVFNSNSVSVTTYDSAFDGRTMTYYIYGS